MKNNIQIIYVGMTCFIASLNTHCSYHVHWIKDYNNKDDSTGQHGDILLPCRSIPKQEMQQS